ncbi:MAG: hypothetical protein U1E87_09795 [Alphaproteobacteria bacterium]
MQAGEATPVSKGCPMSALGVIFGFIVLIALLNLVEYRRFF